MIAILGWGSLIWKPQNLPYQGAWKAAGPALPLEFSRITSQRPLNVVLDPTHGVVCPTRFAFSSRTHLFDAVKDLQQREAAAEEHIGYLDLQHDLSSIQDYPQQINVDETIRRWCQSHQLSAAIWTAIPPNFEERLGVEFSVPAAFQYFKNLSKPQQESTLEYIQNTPAEIDTPLRRRIAAGA